VIIAAAVALVLVFGAVVSAVVERGEAPELAASMARHPAGKR
jgi:hypothetical protein